MEHNNILNHIHIHMMRTRAMEASMLMRWVSLGRGGKLLWMMALLNSLGLQ